MFKVELFKSDPDPYSSRGSDPVNHFAAIMSRILDPDLSVSGHVLGKRSDPVFFSKAGSIQSQPWLATIMFKVF